jgi:hypothetical protein
MNNHDSGMGSLRDTIATAPSGAIINFASSLHGQTITLTKELDISKDLTIEGLGAGALTISGNDASRVFHISGSVTVNISELTIADGKSTGTLAALGIFTGSGGPSGAGGGGGILNEAGATLNLTQDAFVGNQAVGAVGFTVVGGALLNLGTAHVQTCGFFNNQATGGGAPDAIGGSGGGAIDNFGGPTGGATLTVADSLFSNNHAVAAGGNFYFGLGGAIESDAGLNSFDPNLAQPSTATITHTAFLDNFVTGGPNAIGNGGALLNLGANMTLRSTMTLIGCTVSDNRSVGGGGGDGVTTGDSDGVGGGLNNILGTLNIMGCTITGNAAIGGDNTIISDADPSAGGAFGGGIENNAGGVLNIRDSLIAGNIAQGGATAAGPGADACGGGIENSAAFAPGGTVTVTNCIIAGNSAIAGHGGPGTNSQLVHAQAGFAIGGGLDTSKFGSSATITGSWITGNQAVGGAGGAGNNGGNGLGGGLGIGWGSLVGLTEGSQLTVINSDVTNNLASGGAGGKRANGGNGLGGGLFVAAGTSAEIEQSSFLQNQALGGAGGKAGGSDGQGVGGGIYIEPLALVCLDTKTKVKHNTASTSNDDIFGTFTTC